MRTRHTLSIQGRVLQTYIVCLYLQFPCRDKSHQCRVYTHIITTASQDGAYHLGSEMWEMGARRSSPFGIRLPTEHRARVRSEVRCRLQRESSALEMVEYERVDLSERQLEDIKSGALAAPGGKRRYHSCARGRWKSDACSDCSRTDSGTQGHEMMGYVDGHGGVIGYDEIGSCLARQYVVCPGL